MARRNDRGAAAAREEHLRSVWNQPERRETDLVAVDPGDRWTGVAFFKQDEDGKWYCQDAVELGREEFEDAFTELILTEKAPPIVIYERWRLYEDHVNNQKGSEFDASQIIGVIKFVCRQRNDHVGRHDKAEAEGKMMTCELEGGTCADPTQRPAAVEIYGQMADIKKPTAGILRHKKIKSVAKPIAKELYSGRDHIVDAELHGWKHILDVRGESPALS